MRTPSHLDPAKGYFWGFRLALGCVLGKSCRLIVCSTLLVLYLSFDAHQHNLSIRPIRHAQFFYVFKVPGCPCEDEMKVTTFSLYMGNDSSFHCLTNVFKIYVVSKVVEYFFYSGTMLFVLFYGCSSVRK